MKKSDQSIRYTAKSFSGYFVFLVLFSFIFTSCTPAWEIDNPYESVDWSNYGQYKGNFHTHTTNSDGWMNPQMVVDKFHELGYNILAITDHNEVTYPWTGFSDITPHPRSFERLETHTDEMPENLIYEDRDPEALGMIAIQANELSSHHHTGSFFNDHSGTTTIEESLEATEAKNGITMLYHPGRYQERNPQRYSTEWYIDLYERYEHLIGLEVYNQGNKYPEDRKLWDSILIATMPDRPVWGYSNDDMHRLNQLGYNWNVFILPELTSESVRHGMENGISYLVYAPHGHHGPAPPVIESINVNKRKGTIEIFADNHTSVQWISDGKIIYEGNPVSLKELDEVGSYIRAKIYGSGESVAGTQPFGIRR